VVAVDADDSVVFRIAEQADNTLGVLPTARATSSTVGTVTQDAASKTYRTSLLILPIRVRTNSASDSGSATSVRAVELPITLASSRA